MLFATENTKLKIPTDIVPEAKNDIKCWYRNRYKCASSYSCNVPIVKITPQISPSLGMKFMAQRQRGA